MDGSFQWCYPIGFMSWHREGKGKLQVSKESSVYVRKITEHMCMTTYLYAIQPIFGVEQNIYTHTHTHTHAHTCGH